MPSKGSFSGVGLAALDQQVFALIKRHCIKQNLRQLVGFGGQDDVARDWIVAE